MTSEGNLFIYCLTAMSPSRAQCRPLTLYVCAQIAESVNCLHLIVLIDYIRYYKIKKSPFVRYNKINNDLAEGVNPWQNALSPSLRSILIYWLNCVMFDLKQHTFFKSLNFSEVFRRKKTTCFFITRTMPIGQETEILFTILKKVSWLAQRRLNNRKPHHRCISFP